MGSIRDKITKKFPDMKGYTMQKIIEGALKESPFVLIEIGSGQCMPCKAIKEKIERWLIMHKEVQFYYISIEDDPALCSQMGIFTVPALLLYGEGKLIQQKAGYFSLTEVFDKIERIERILDK